MRAAEPAQDTLPIDFAPPVVREHGLVEAHTAPLVGVRLRDDGVRSLGRRSPEEAWGYPLLEWSRSGRATTVLALDCDSDKSIGVVLDALRDVDAPIARPSLVVERKRSGHVLACWCLETPVGRGPHARRAPLSFLGRVSEYYSAVADADPGFVSVLCANPVHSDYRAYWGARDPYSLRDLGAVMPRGWRAPAFDRCRSEGGRNSTLFMLGCRFAGNLSRTDEEVAWWIRGQNMRHGIYRDSLLTPAPLPAAEVEGIIRSINGHYRPQWRARTAQLPFVERQRWRGRRSGKVRWERPGCLMRERPWEAERVSRATWYRRRETRTNTGSPPPGGKGEARCAPSPSPSEIRHVA